MTYDNILVFGAGGGNIGHHILQALVSDAVFNVTVLARESSRTTFPKSVKVVRVSDNFPHDDVVAALAGQDVVICTTGFAAHEIQYNLIDAAVQAGVKRFIPSEWGIDNADPNNQVLCPVFKLKAEVAEYLKAQESDSFSWTAVANGVWLDWALDESFIGIDPKHHTAEYWCNGTHAPSCTTLPYVAQATLQILKHPKLFKSQRVFLSPFQASQREIVAELERLQGMKYQVFHVNSVEVVKESKLRWEGETNLAAAGTLVSAGVLLPGHGADFVSSKKTPILEDQLEMPKLDLEVVIKAWLDKVR